MADENFHYKQGQWKSFDRILDFLNTIDTSLYTTKELKKFIYHSLMEMKPVELEKFLDKPE